VSQMVLPSSIDELGVWLHDHAIDTVIAGASDVNANWIGKRLTVEEFLAASRSEGVAFSEVLFVVTRDGQHAVEPPGGASYPGYFPRKERGYPDVFWRADPLTVRTLPWHDSTAAILGHFTSPNGVTLPIDPRGLLATQLGRARSMGLEPLFASEFEFYLFKGTFADIHGDEYRLQPLSPRPYTYSVARSSADEHLLRNFRESLIAARVPVEGLNAETGPGQYEINIHYGTAIDAADAAFLYKNVIKELAQRAGLTASFMAKPRTEWSGSSCHLHQSLRSIDTGEALFASGESLADLSDVARHYIGGLLATAGDFMALFAPTVNSYKRLVDYSWAGTSVSWGMDNRSVSCRVVGRAPSARRVEHRVPGADVNPYVAMAACLAGGLYGIEHGIEPPEPYQADVYADPTVERLPRSLKAALDRLDGSDVARELLGSDFINYYQLMKRWEVAQHDSHVSDWEIRHYIETA
jgi:glutamine synthetase